ncbi:autotransporter outer membrane beta-barrel domain-containing protein [Burkholderia pyrrocinia]|nr:autotransporter outer membrane beta-barrel domain-containing protein [Burkholderia pyrrocinia]
MSGTGAVHLLDGTNVTAAGDNSGFSGAFNIDNGATLTAGAQRNLGSAAIANAGTVALDGYNGALSNNVSGAGAVHLLNGANVTAAGDNSGFSGTFNIDSGTTLTAGAQQNLGAAAIVNGGQLAVNTTTDWRLGNAVSGVGDLIKEGTGRLTVGDALTYSGKTDVQAGTLIVGDAATPGVTLGAQGAGTVTVRQGATLAGLGTVSGQVLNAGTVSAFNTLSGPSAAAGTLTLANGLVNSGTVNLAGTSVGNQLVVKNGYVGNAGTVVLNTVMGSDNAATDKLVIDGGNASGNTALVVKHAGGNGAQTTQGIRVVQTANGGTTDANAFSLSPSSDGYRSGFDSIVSGRYDYRLQRGGTNGVANDWYLTSQSQQNPQSLQSPQLRPEVGSYLSNRQFAQTMQFHTLHDRSGQATGGGDAAQGAADDAGAWANVAGKVASRSGAGGLDVSDTSYIVRAGTDVLRASDGGEGRVRVGVMGAYGSDNSRAGREGLNSSGSVDGYNAGVYATWYGNRDVLFGPYADSWVMYGTFNNKVSGQGLPTERYQSSNLAASVEGGYSFQIYQGENARVFLQPQAQVIVSSYHANTHTEQNGTVVSGQSGTSVTTRVGVRLFGSVKDGAIGRGEMLPFTELNWWHGPASQSIAFDGVAVTDGMPADRVEGKIGLQGKVSKAVTVWGGLGFEVGTRNYAAGNAQLGLKYTW